MLVTGNTQKIVKALSDDRKVVQSIVRYYSPYSKIDDPVFYELIEEYQQ